MIEGKEFPRLSTQDSTRAGIQVIYQDLSLFPNLTVAENIGVAGHFGMPHLVRWSAIRKSRKRRWPKIGVSLDLSATVGDLSIANRQLVAICRALTADAKLLDHGRTHRLASLALRLNGLLSLVRSLKAKGICIVFVSHRLDEVLEVAGPRDRAARRQEGRHLPGARGE